MRFTEASRALALELLELCAASLGCEGETFGPHFPVDDGSFTRLNFYPIEADLASGPELPEPGPLGISRHTDAGALTVLLQDEVAGLEVWHDDSWHEVTPVHGALTINIGDMLQVWSNDRFRAPLHRVRPSSKRSRYSIAYFLNPGRDSVIQPLASCTSERNPALYRQIPWQAFRDLRAQGDYGDYGEEVQIEQYRY